jgi:uncharacterized membrane protein YbaN (DUF454 family)
VFIAGLLLGGLAFTFYQFNKLITNLVLGIRSSVQKNDFIIWLSKREFLQRASRFIREYAFTIPIPFLILILYIWLASSGTWTKWNSPTNYYASLANGFKNGTLAVDKKPSQQLLELDNPYDMDSWTEDIHIPVDMTYYEGNFYLYWGPVPSLIIFLLKPLYNHTIGDLQITFIFTYGIFFCLYILIITLWDDYYRELPKWTLQITLLLAGLTAPLTFMLAAYKGGRIYEAAIASGAFFLTAGFLFVISALNKTGMHASFRLFIGGVFWALSIGSRMTLVIPIGLIMLLAVSWFYKQEGISYKALIPIAALCLPLGIGAVGIGWYNWARFGSVTESGLHYQLLTDGYLRNFKEWAAFDIIYIPQNFYNYLLFPFKLTNEFPFMFPQPAYDPPIFSFYRLPEVYTGQWVTGLLFTAPFVLFALVPFTKSFKDRHQEEAHQKHNRSRTWTIAALGIGFIGAVTPLLAFFWSAMRYQADFMPFLLTLSILGFWQILQSAKSGTSQRKALTAFSIGLIIITLVNSTLIALAANDARFTLLELFR